VRQSVLPGLADADGVTWYGVDTWEGVYKQGHWVATKNGLTSAFASDVALIPSMGLGAALLINAPSGFLADRILSRLFSAMIPAMQEAIASVSKVPAGPRRERERQRERERDRERERKRERLWLFGSFLFLLLRGFFLFVRVDFS
jgi:hypothetical protein